MSGLDAAAAENIMQEIVRVAKDERIIILCTIHQPSTKVYNGFDETMILSRARTAYSGDVNGAVPYFERIGYPLPPQTNPAEHFLDLGTLRAKCQVWYLHEWRHVLIQSFLSSSQCRFFG